MDVVLTEESPEIDNNIGENEFENDSEDKTDGK